MAPSSEIFIDDILKKSLIFKEKRLDLIGRKKSPKMHFYTTYLPIPAQYPQKIPKSGLSWHVKRKKKQNRHKI